MIATRRLQTGAAFLAFGFVNALTATPSKGAGVLLRLAGYRYGYRFS